MAQAVPDFKPSVANIYAKVIRYYCRKCNNSSSKTTTKRKAMKVKQTIEASALLQLIITLCDQTYQSNLGINVCMPRKRSINLKTKYCLPLIGSLVLK